MRDLQRWWYGWRAEYVQSAKKGAHLAIQSVSGNALVVPGDLSDLMHFISETTLEVVADQIKMGFNLRGSVWRVNMVMTQVNAPAFREVVWTHLARLEYDDTTLIQGLQTESGYSPGESILRMYLQSLGGTTANLNAHLSKVALPILRPFKVTAIREVQDVATFEVVARSAKQAEQLAETWLESIPEDTVWTPKATTGVYVDQIQDTNEQ